MLPNGNGLAYFAGMDGDFTGKPRSVVWMLSVVVEPKEVPFLIDGIQIDGSPDQLGKSHSASTERWPKYTEITIGRRISANSKDLMHAAVSGRVFNSVLILMAFSGNAGSTIQLKLGGVSLITYQVNAMSAVSTSDATAKFSLSPQSFEVTYIE